MVDDERARRADATVADAYSGEALTTGELRRGGVPPARVRELSGRLAGLSLPRQVWVLAIWPFFEQVLSLMVGTIDQALAGYLEPAGEAEAASAALGAGLLVGWAVHIVHMSVGIGVMTLVARATGGRHRGLARSALGQAMLLAIGAGAVTAAGLVVGSFFLPQLTGLEERGTALLRIYMRYLALASPAGAVIIIGSAALRGAGDTRAPFFVMVLVNIVNAASSWLLVYGPGPIGGHGVAGIALGTVIAWWLGMMLILWHLLTGRTLKLMLHRMRPHMHTMKRIVRVGLPTFLEIAGGMWLATFVVLAIVGRIGGELTVAAHMIAVRIEAFSFQPGSALGIAAATLVGQYLGLGDPHRAKQAAWLCFAVAGGLMAVMGGLFIALPDVFTGVFTDVAPIREAAAPLVQICGGIQIFFASHMVFGHALRGAGDVRPTMIMTYTAAIFIRVPLAYVLGIVLDYGLNGVWVALSIDIFVRGMVFAWWFYRGRWMEVEV